MQRDYAETERYARGYVGTQYCRAQAKRTNSNFGLSSISAYVSDVQSVFAKSTLKQFFV